METMDAILTRRSIRSYTGEPVTEEQLQKILHAGFSAPTARKLRPNEYVVIREPATLKSICDAHPYASMLQQAGCGILICGDTTRQPDPGYLAQDSSASMENMLLAAHSMGLGAVWLGIYPRPERMNAIRAIFSLPETVIPMALMAVGHVQDAVKSEDRYDAARVHWEQW